MLLVAFLCCSLSGEAEESKIVKKRLSSTITKLVRNKSAEEIQGMIQEIRDQAPPSDYSKLEPFKRSKGTQLVGLADALYNVSTSDRLLEESYKAKIEGLAILAERNPGELSKFALIKKELEKLDKFPKLAETCDAYSYILTVQKAVANGRITERKLEEISTELKEYLQNDPNGPYVEAAMIFVSAVLEMEEAPRIAQTAQTIRVDYLSYFRTSDNQKLKQFLKNYEADILPGTAQNKMLKIRGMTLNERPFDIRDLRGKIVMLYFWETGNVDKIRDELPKIGDAYRKFGPKGFEIVCICTDDNMESIMDFFSNRGLPGVQISDKLTKRAGMPALAGLCGIKEKPRIILIGTNGRVINTEPKADKLEEILEKHFPSEQ